MRINYLDGIRGHLLLGMMIAHLMIFGNQTFLIYFHHATIISMYDAEFFIPVSGFLVGYIYYERLKSSGQRVIFLTHRLRTIYRYFLFGTLPTMILVHLTDWNMGVASISNIMKEIALIFLLQNVGPLSDVLIIYLYCFLIIATLPYALAFIKLRTVLYLSSIVYLVSQTSYTGGFLGISSTKVTFDISAWQFLFMLAFTAGANKAYLYEKIHSLSDRNLLIIIAAALIVYSATLLFSNFPTPFPTPTTVHTSWPRLDLHPIFLIRIISMVLLLALVILHPSRLVKWPRKVLRTYFSWTVLENIGKYGIQMFTLHIYFMIIFVTYAPSLTQLQQGIFAATLILSFAIIPNIYQQIINSPASKNA